MQSHSFGAPGNGMNQAPASGSVGVSPSQPKQKVRARRGQATDPHSIAERVRLPTKSFPIAFSFYLFLTCSWLTQMSNPMDTKTKIDSIFYCIFFRSF